MGDTLPSRRTILLHGGVYTASRFLNQGVVFLLLPLYAHLLGTQGVGVVEVLSVARAFLAALFAQGLEAAWFRLRFGVEGDAKVRLESTVIWYLLGSGIVGLGILYVAGDRLSPLVTPGLPFVPLGLITAVNAVALLFPALLERKLQGDQRPMAFALWSLVKTTTTVCGVIVFVAVLRRGAPGKIEAEALAAVALAVAALVLLAPRLTMSRKDLVMGLRYGVPLMPHTFAGLSIDLIDRYILSALLGLSAVGVYSMGYRMAGAAMTVTVAVNQAFSPVFMSTLEQAREREESGHAADAERLRARLASIAFVNVVVGCVIAQVVTALAREALTLMTTPAFAESWRVVAPVCAGVVAWSWYGSLSQAVMFRRETVHRMPLITLAAMLTNIAANYLLIPRFGMMGAAWATLASGVAMAGGALVVGMKTLPLPFAFRRWSIASGSTFLSLAVLFWLDAHVPEAVLRIGMKGVWLATALGLTSVATGVRPGAVRELLSRRG